MASEKQSAKNAELRRLWELFFKQYDRAVLAKDEGEKKRMRAKVEAMSHQIFLNKDF